MRSLIEVADMLFQVGLPVVGLVFLYPFREPSWAACAFAAAAFCVSWDTRRKVFDVLDHLRKVK